MSRSSTPGSPAGRPAAPHGNRARSFDYAEGPEVDEVVRDQALVTTPGHGGVGVFQAPRPVQRRAPQADPGPVTDTADIDSPFLDLFAGTRPGARPPQQVTGREQPAIPQQPVAPPPPGPGEVTSAWSRTTS
ncbi:ATP-binding protein, partial [Micromonospora sp. URMC 106]